MFENLVSKKSADPRYEVDDGRRTPPFYRTEVESARQRILDFLDHTSSSAQCGKDSSSHPLFPDPTVETRDFGLRSPREFVNRELLDSSFPRNMSYCFEVKQRPPSLALMPVHPHGSDLFTSSLLTCPHRFPEDALDPCDSGIDEGGALKKYRRRVHDKEIPHVSYASKVPCESDLNSPNPEQPSPLSEVVSTCDLYVANQRARDMLVNVSIDDLDNESYRTWMDCTQLVIPPTPPLSPLLVSSYVLTVAFSKMGLAYRFNTKALTQGILCLPHTLSEGEDSEPFPSCLQEKKLKILILHNHCPLFTRCAPPFPPPLSLILFASSLFIGCLAMDPIRDFITSLRRWLG
jgi:hypothetical protein